MERRDAVELGATAFREFLRYHAARRVDGRPWRLVIAGDLFDFMSVVDPERARAAAKTADERRLGLGARRRTRASRGMRRSARRIAPLLADLVAVRARPATRSISSSATTTSSCSSPRSIAELRAPAARAPAPSDGDARARSGSCRGSCYVPGVAWIEHGHVYDEGCSFEFNLAPTDPKDGRLVYNADYAAIRYLGTALPELDPHGIEEWSFWGFLRYAAEQGVRSFGRLLGRVRAGSVARWSARARCTSRCKPPRRAPARASRAARAASRRPAASRSRPRARSIGSRARR